MLIGGALFGNTFYEHADPFEVYSTLVAKLSVWGRARRTCWSCAARSPTWTTVPVAPGLVAVVAVLLRQHRRSTRSRTPRRWVQFIQGTDASPLPAQQPGAARLLPRGRGDLRARHDGHRRRRRTTGGASCPPQFAHSIVPIIVGYIIAHYLTYLVEVGQQTLIQASDPFSTRWQLPRHRPPGGQLLALLPPDAAGRDQGRLAVVVGHVLGVIAAHDRACSCCPTRHQLTGQLPLLVAMVGFTVGGLYLLFAA